MRRLRIVITGLVQGIGFRPFVYRLATSLSLVGWVQNSTQGVTIEVEGTPTPLETFIQHLQQDKPPLAIYQQFDCQELEPGDDRQFEIRSSATDGATLQKTALVLPDLAPCPECLDEIFDPTNRRYRYPFTNCIYCGPRHSILTGLPYDRPNTTLASFRMCPACQEEYTHPRDRRFHAQPNACPACGPHLELWDTQGHILSDRDNALQDTVAAIRQGKILAIKGLGGFHLVVDARNPDAVQTLRERKRRPDKPFALMYPSLAQIQTHCWVSEPEAQCLRSPQAPIVLLRQKYLRRHLEPDHVQANHVEHQEIQGELPPHLPSPSVSPDNPYLGVMLPATPLHHLLLRELGFPIVATSGNRSDEPICIDETEALDRLAGIADRFLVHNRAIVRPLDDSILRVVEGQPMLLRRARGYAPLPIPWSHAPRSDPSRTILAVGAHLKNTVAFLLNDQLFLSQHFGDLDHLQSLERMEEAIEQFLQLYAIQPDALACDAHPDYGSTAIAQGLARRYGVPLIPVQHHYAHVLAGLAEHGLQPPVLGIAWDGTGYGGDGTIWGGECLTVHEAGFERSGYLRPFPLPGGDRAAREPRRSALGLLYGLGGEAIWDWEPLPPFQAFSPQEFGILPALCRQGINTPLTSSVGRFLDGIASLLDLRQRSSFEGQAAMALEFAIVPDSASYAFEIYPLEIQTPEIPLPPPSQAGTCFLGQGVTHIIDWHPLVQELLRDRQRALPVGVIAAKVHNTWVEILVQMAQRIGVEQVLLTGGCFQNRYLLERAIGKLRAAGFRPYWPQRIPTNDGGIAIGQLLGALRVMESGCGDRTR